MKSLLVLLCVIVMLGSVSTCLALNPILMGNFEDGSVEYNPSDIRWDGWMINLDSSAVTTPAQAATLDSYSLKWVDVDGGSWLGSDTTYPYGGTLDEKLEAWLNPGSAISVDVTAIGSEVEGGWVSLCLFYNAGGGWGFDDTTWQDVIIDGQPHTYEFQVTEQVKTVIQGSIGTWGCNLGFGMRSTDGTSTTIYIDNIWIYPEGSDAPYYPHDPSYVEVPNGDFSDITLKWKASADRGEPNRLPDPNVIYAVNPDIVDEYVFMSTDTDPNLLYVGNTGIDPGTDDPNSSYVLPNPLPVNSAYQWCVVDVLDGYEQTLTPGVSLPDDMDPNNLLGPIWTLQTRTTTPVIDIQPVSTRFGVNDADAQFTIGVDIGYNPAYQWFYSLDNVIDAGDTAISASIGGQSDTLTIATHNKAYQAYYYCRVSNSYTFSGGGSEPDVYSVVVSLVVERKVAEYLFDGNLNDTSGMGFNGTGVGSPTFVAGVDAGSALSLDGSTQYVEIGDSGDPNTFNKCFPRADLFTDTEDGLGGGLDVGSITCWVKLNATVADQVSPIMANGNGGWPHTEFKFEIPTDSGAANTNLRTIIWGDDEVLTMVDVNPVYADPFNMASDGQWHMLASAWDRDAGTMKAYLDGNLLATWGSSPSVFSAWDNTMTIGFDGTNYFGGAIDNLRIYNYELTPEEIVDQYGAPGCIYDFDGSNHNSNQLGSSYCKLDLADIADLAVNWLNDGFYTP